MASRHEKEKVVNVHVQLRCRSFSGDKRRSNASKVVKYNDYLREVAISQNIAGKQIDHVFTFDKMCVQIFIKLIKDWGTKNISKDKIGGFRSIIFEKFATNCCLYSLLDKSFDFRDANTVVLPSEIVLAHKVMYEKFGDDFITHFKSNSLPSAHCPQQLANLYSLNLKVGICYEEAYAVLNAAPLSQHFDRTWISHVQLLCACDLNVIIMSYGRIVEG